MSTAVRLRMLRVGACRHLDCMAARGGRLGLVDFPALCGLIHHPNHGWILYDTGYAEHFFDATQTWPERLYRMALPAQLPPNEALVNQLMTLGITPADISMVIVSHYHGDHIAGLKDFPNARFIALRADTDRLKSLNGHRLKATMDGLLLSLLPANFFSRLHDAETCRSLALPDWMAPFSTAYDLLGDGSILGVPLPGHSDGQLGLLIPDANGRPAFLVADACWSLPACKEGRLPSRFALFVNADRQRFQETFLGVRALALREPEVSILPSHCTVAWEEYTRAI
ncbi:MAG: MBL fold metallo-hydrolase [Halothiobacillus sp.]|jgi:glyoxylase-like metal-dependent hydrolase (beta-lactamase superfamily II)|nr:MBL fold metallo-hydrolase [Halothiobacillus sp.]